MSTVPALRSQLLWLTAVRALFAVILLVLLPWWLPGDQQAGIFLAVGAGVAILTGVSAVVLSRAGADGLLALAWAQVMTDLVLEATWTAWTGSIHSPFSLLLVMTAMMAGLLLGWPGGLLATAVGTVAVSALLAAAHFSGLTLRTGELAQVALFEVVFLTAGLLTSRLAKQLRTTEQRLLEKERGLNQLLAVQEHIVQSLSSGLFTTEVDDHIISFSRAAQEITRYGTESVQGKSWREVFGWQQARLIEADPYTLQTPLSL